MNLSLFDLQPVPTTDPCSSSFSSSIEARKQEEPLTPDLIAALPDVARVVVHKTHKPSIELRGGQPTGREFFITELHDESIICVYADTGERIAAPRYISSILLNDHIANGAFVEVRG